MSCEDQNGRYFQFEVFSPDFSNKSNDFVPASCSLKREESQLRASESYDFRGFPSKKAIF